MLGTIIGDISGSTREFNNVKSLDFQTITEDSSFTDDTICTIAVADAILNQKPFTDTMVSWCRRYPRPMGGYGAGFLAWLRSEDHLPYNSFGNGAAMRVAPVAWLYDRYEDVVLAAYATASISHDHPEGKRGAMTIASCIYGLRKGAPKDFVRDFVSLSYDIPEYAPFSNPFDESCMNAVPVAVSCFLAGNDFEDVIRKAVAVGGDSDTIAAIAGSLAEAFYPIPEHLKKQALALLPEKMIGIIRDFYQCIGCCSPFGKD
ncbi:MAG: ADP-ribosylglycohydrolase family protein [Bacteroidales bacterium]|nr:ADP-ribosylglycohydrolase family protein [Bacteroidales bacterium]